MDLCYIKDMARAIALLQTKEKLPHDVYNVSGGMVTRIGSWWRPSREWFRASRWTSLGRWPGPLFPVLDTGQLRADTGFSPAFDLRSVVSDYVEWLRAGNHR